MSWMQCRQLIGLQLLRHGALPCIAENHLQQGEVGLQQIEDWSLNSGTGAFGLVSALMTLADMGMPTLSVFT